MTEKIQSALDPASFCATMKSIGEQRPKSDRCSPMLSKKELRAERTVIPAQEAAGELTMMGRQKRDQRHLFYEFSLASTGNARPRFNK
jgi:hypothetical protein